MRMTQGVVSNLVNRYRAVLKKCHLLNVFGTLAVATLLCGSVGVAQAAITTDNATLTVESGKVESLDGGKTYKVTAAARDSVTITGGSLVMQSGSTLNLNVSGGVLVQNNGTLEMKGANLTGAVYDGEGKITSGPTMEIGSATSSGNLLISAGENVLEVALTVKQGRLTVNEGARLSFAKKDFTGAFTTIGGEGFAPTVTVKGIMDTAGLTVNSGTVEVLGKGHLETDTLTLNKGTITADKLIVVGDPSLAPRDTTGIVVENIMNVSGGKVTVNSLDVFTKTNPKDPLSPQSDAVLDIRDSGDVQVAGNATITKGDHSSGSHSGSDAKIWLNGGILHVKGDLRASSGGIFVQNTGGTVVNGTLALDQNFATAIKGGNLNFGALDFNASGDRAAGITLSEHSALLQVLGLGEDKSFSNAAKIDIIEKGILNLGAASTPSLAGKAKGGTFAGAVNVSGGTLAVHEGNWTLNGKTTVSGAANAVTIGAGSSLKVADVTVTGNVSGSINVAALGTMKGNATNFVATRDASGNFTLNTASGGAGISGGFSGSQGILMLDGTATYSQAQLKKLSNDLGITVGFTNGTFSGDVKVSGSESIVANKNKVELTDSGSLTGTVIAQTVQASGNATSLSVGSAGSGSLTVLGTGSGNVITNASGAALETITLGAGGSLGLGSAAFAAVAQGGSVGKLEMSGSGAQVIVQQGTFTAAAVDMKAGDGKLTVNAGGSLVTEKLTAKSGDTITVGTPDSAGTLIAKNVKLAGASLYMDPSWGTAGVHAGTYGSRVALQFSGNKVDGLLTVGNASQLTLGTDNVQWLSDNLGKGQQWGTGITAALGVYSQQQLDAASGGILVDGTASGPSAKAHELRFAGKSLLAVNAPAGMQAAGGALMAGNATDKLTVNADAKLMIVGGNDKDVVKIVSGFSGSSSIDASSWTGGNLLTDTSMMQATVDSANKTGADYRVTLSRTGFAEHSFPMLSEGGAQLVNALFDQNRRDVNSPDAGIRFLSRAVGDQGGIYVKDATDSARIIEGAARLGASAGVSQATLGAVSAATTAVMNRTSLANPLTGAKTTAVVSDPETHSWNTENGANAGDSNKAGSTALWIMPLYQSNNSWGMKAGNFKTGLTSDLFGVALGADYGISDEFRIGASFNIGGGHAQSKGDFYKTTNDFNFWGVSIYGGYAANNLALMADVGYTGMYNKAKQELPSSMAMGDLKSDIESSAITAGLRGEYKIPTDVMDFTPYVGVRYTGMSTQDYKAKADGGTVFKNSTDMQNVWTFPIGLSLSKDVETSNGWTVKPQLDLGIIAAAGDLQVRNSAKVAGLATSADMKTQVVDGITFDGGLGFNVAKDNVSLGLTYNLQMSEHRTGHGVNAIFRYEF